MNKHTQAYPRRKQINLLDVRVSISGELYKLWSGQLLQDEYNTRSDEEVPEALAVENQQKPEGYVQHMGPVKYLQWKGT